MKTLQLKNGKTLIIRKAAAEDAEKIIQYMQTIGGESDFLTFGDGELQITLEKEQQIIESMNGNPNSIMAVAEMENEIVGIYSFSPGFRMRTKHAGEFGISVRKAYWSMGIGKAMLEELIRWAKENGTIRKINLRVRTDNVPAIELYKKFGFIEEGVVTRDFLIGECFYDSLLMGLCVD